MYAIIFIRFARETDKIYTQRLHLVHHVFSHMLIDGIN